MRLDTLRSGDVLLGNQVVSKIYKGDTLIYPIEDDQSLVFLDYIEVVDQRSLIVLEDFIPTSRDIRVVTSMILAWTTYIGWSGGSPFGTRYNYNDSEWRFIFGGSYGNTSTSIGMNSFNTDGGYRYDNNNPYYLDQVNYHTVDLNVNKLYVDSRLICECSTGRSYVNHPQKFSILGTLVQGTDYWSDAAGRRYRYFKIWYQGNLLYDLLPAKKGKVYGMYNKVTGVFHTPHHPNGTLTGGFD